MMRYLSSILFLVFGLLSVQAFSAPLEVPPNFDHAFHERKVFSPGKIDCSICHTFKINPSSQKLESTDPQARSHFRVTMKQACHQCHQQEQSAPTKTSEGVQAAPQSCFLCHTTMEALARIKPLNHRNVAWRSAHSVEGRLQGSRCTDCHVTSQCVKCHMRRNDVELQNHGRNFRFTHSVVARAQPQRCDACHTKSYCINCHTGGR